jgi:hypothetical protein
MILIPTCSANDWRALLADPDKHWKPGYSAMSAAQSWEAAQGLPPEIASLLGPDATLLLAIPEHKVALPGKGRESQCDIFALARTGNQTVALAVEAKVAEPFGPTVGEWLVAASPGKITRLTALCDLLGCAYPPPDALRYQLFHRAAAAVIEAARFKTDRAAMIVQSFSADHLWFGDFAAFCQFLGHTATQGLAVDHALPSGKTLTLGWATSRLGQSTAPRPHPAQPDSR